MNNPFESNMEFLPTDKEINIFFRKELIQVYSDITLKFYKNEEVTAENKDGIKGSSTLLKLLQQCGITWTGELVANTNSSKKDDVVLYYECYHNTREIYDSITRRRALVHKLQEISADRNTAAFFLEKFKRESSKEFHASIKKFQL